jgi:hypothetical protein
MRMPTIGKDGKINVKKGGYPEPKGRKKPKK